MSESEVRAGAPGCWRGDAVKEKLFTPYVDPVGETIRLGKVACEVIGVLVNKG